MAHETVPADIAAAIDTLVFAVYSHGLGVGDGSLNQIEPKRSADARIALDTVILRHLQADNEVVREDDGA